MAGILHRAVALSSKEVVKTIHRKNIIVMNVDLKSIKPQPKASLAKRLPKLHTQTVVFSPKRPKLPFIDNGQMEPRTLIAALEGR